RAVLCATKASPHPEFVEGRTNSCATPAGIMTGRAAPMLFHAPEREVVVLVVVAGDEGVLVAALGMDVVLGNEERRLHEAAGLFAVEGAVQFVNRLVGLQLDRFRDGDRLILAALPDAVIG